ncbi:hypothetical protein ACWGIU_06530 [Streptomyces sp. NPDC054840]
MSKAPWRETKVRYHVGTCVTGRVRVKFQHGVFLELDGDPEVRAFVDLLSYNPDEAVREGALPEVGALVTGIVAHLVDRDRQLRIRVGPPFWENADRWGELLNGDDGPLPSPPEAPDRTSTQDSTASEPDTKPTGNSGPPAAASALITDAHAHAHG